MKAIFLAALLGASPIAATAQTPAPAPSSEPDPAAVKVSRALMDQVMPPATRDEMMKSMMTSMTQTMIQPLLQSPDLSAALKKEPRARVILDRFIERQVSLGTRDLVENMPGMLDAMARAYARRFSLRQLNEMSAFFSTSTGQAYLSQAPTIMADPDVGAWMTSLMTRSVKRQPDEIARLKSELQALDKKGATQ